MAPMKEWSKMLKIIMFLEYMRYPRIHEIVSNIYNMFSCDTIYQIIIYPHKMFILLILNSILGH